MQQYIGNNAEAGAEGDPEQGTARGAGAHLWPRCERPLHPRLCARLRRGSHSRAAHPHDGAGAAGSLRGERAGTRRARGGTALTLDEPAAGRVWPPGDRCQPRQIALIGRSHRKTDRTDAEQLARLGRVDPQAACADSSSQRSEPATPRRGAQPEHPRALAHQAHQPRPWRGQGVGRLVAAVHRATFHRKVAEHIPTELLPALTTLLEVIGDITTRIALADREIEALCAAYSETTSLRQVTGVGPLTALTFVLTVEDHARFPRAREVGAYLGLVPRQHESGDRQPAAGHHQTRRCLPERAARAGCALHPRSLRA